MLIKRCQLTSFARIIIWNLRNYEELWKKFTFWTCIFYFFLGGGIFLGFNIFIIIVSFWFIPGYFFKFFNANKAIFLKYIFGKKIQKVIYINMQCLWRPILQFSTYFIYLFRDLEFYWKFLLKKIPFNGNSVRYLF